jgi:tRNA modification GTPase
MAGDTIYALSSGPPPAAIAVVRISGPKAGTALAALTGRIPAPRQAAFARLRDPASGEIIDEALALFFPGPKSETGEDVAEVQLHGGRAVIAATFSALSRIEGLRPAEPGEFTRRAFANGKLDLTRVEGLADLIFADTEAQRRQALRQLQGLLGERAEAWRRRIIEAQALAEAGIDFSDEGDVAADVTAQARRVAGELLQELRAALADSARGERLRDGLVVAIAGPPNAGKSTLLNRLARREAAIVSPFAGTTRDVIEVHLDLGGYPVTLLDTAGIRETNDPVEREGVARARKRAGEADLVLWVEEAGSASDREIPFLPPAREARDGEGGEPQARSRASSTRYDEPGGGVIEDDSAPHPRPLPATSLGSAGGGEFTQTWLVLNKSDLVKDEALLGRTRPVEDRGTELPRALPFAVSASTGEGVPALAEALTRFAAETFGSREPALVTRQRQRQALEVAANALERAVSETRDDILAEELRISAQALGRLTGRVDVEDILDVIFQDFCIGK